MDVAKIAIQISADVADAQKELQNLDKVLDQLSQAAERFKVTAESLGQTVTRLAQAAGEASASFATASRQMTAGIASFRESFNAYKKAAQGMGTSLNALARTVSKVADTFVRASLAFRRASEIMANQAGGFRWNAERMREGMKEMGTSVRAGLQAFRTASKTLREGFKDIGTVARQVTQTTTSMNNAVRALGTVASRTAATVSKASTQVKAASVTAQAAHQKASAAAERALGATAGLGSRTAEAADRAAGSLNRLARSVSAAAGGMGRIRGNLTLAAGAADDFSGRASRGFRGVNAHLYQTHRQTGFIARELGRLTYLAFDFLAAFMGIKALVALWGAWRSAAIDFNAQLESAQVFWTNILGSSDKATAVMERFRVEAMKSPFRARDIQEAAQLMVGWGFSVENVIPILRALSYSLQAVGRVTRSDLMGALTQLGQILTATRLRTQDLNVLAQHAIPVWDILARAYGKSTAEIRKMVEEGLIPANVFLAEFVKHAQEKWGPVAEAQLATFNLAVSNLQDGLESFMAKAMEPLFTRLRDLALTISKYLLTDEFRAWTYRVSGAVDAVLTALGGLARGFARAFRYIADVVFSIGSVILQGLQLLNPFARHSPSLVELVEKGVDAIVTAFGRLRAVDGPLGDVVTAITNFAGRAGEKLKELAGKADEARREALDLLGEGAADAFFEAEQGLNKLEESLDSLGRRLEFEKARLKAFSDEIDASIELFLLQRQGVIDVNSILDSYQRGVDEATQELRELGIAVEDTRLPFDGLNEIVRDLESNLRKLARVPLKGMRELDDASFDLEMQILQVQKKLNELKLSDAPKEQIKEVENELEKLRIQQDQIDIEKRLKFDPLQRQLERLTDTTAELTFEEVVGQIDDTKRKLGELAQQRGKVDTLAQAHQSLTDRVRDLRAALDEAARSAERLATELEKAARKGAGGGAGAGAPAMPVAGLPAEVIDVEAMRRKLQEFQTAFEETRTKTSQIIGSFAQPFRRLGELAAAHIKPSIEGLRTFMDTEFRPSMETAPQRIQMAWEAFTSWFSTTVQPRIEGPLGAIKEKLDQIGWAKALDFGAVASGIASFALVLAPLGFLLKPIVGLLGGMARNLGLIAGVGVVAAGAALAFQLLWPVIQEKVIPALQGVADQVRTNVTVGFQTLSDTVQNQVLPTIEGFATRVSTQLAPTLDQLQQKAREAGTSLQEAFTGFAQQDLPRLWQDLRSFGEDVGKIVGPAIEKFFTSPATQQFLLNMGEAAKKVGPILGRVLSILASLGEILLQILRPLAPILAGILAYGLPSALSVLSGVLNILLGVAEILLSIADGVLGIIAGILRGDWEQVKEKFNGMIEGIKSGLGTIWESLWNLLDPSGETRKLLEKFDVAGFIKKGGELLGGIIEGIQKGFPDLGPVLSSLKDEALKHLPEIGSWLLEKGGELLKGLIDGIIGKLPDLGGEVGKLKDKVLEALPNVVKWLVEKGEEAVKGMIQGVANKFGDLSAEAGKLKDTVLGALPNPIEWLVQKGNEVVKGLGKGITDTLGSLGKEVEKIKTAVLDALPNPEKLLESTGKKIVQGLWSGIESMLGWLARMFNEGIGRAIGVNIPIPSATTPSTQVPAMASGGIVTRPTLALLGERGPEAVIPLDRAPVTVYAVLEVDSRQIARAASYGLAAESKLRLRLGGAL